MVDELTAHQDWGVFCLHCKEPIPLQVDFPGRQTSSATSGLLSLDEDRVFLAWCQACFREAPYSTREIVAFLSPAPRPGVHARLWAMRQAG